MSGSVTIMHWDKVQVIVVQQSSSLRDDEKRDLCGPMMSETAVFSVKMETAFQTL